jgi:glycosyltransferase involved in cell wall biosynthesis
MINGKRLGYFGARSDRTGLGNEWVALTKALKPDLILLVNSHSFNRNAQFPERYDGFQVATSEGFPNRQQVLWFLQRVDIVLCIETPYTYELFSMARQMGKKVFFLVNVEFWDELKFPDYPKPYRIIAPSPWRFDEVQALHPDAVMIPPPTIASEFQASRDVNLARTGRRRFIHPVGTPAVQDRAGTEVLIAALAHSTADYELVIRCRSTLACEVNDYRVKFDFTDAAEQAELYTDADAIIHPRKYAGLNLIMNEGLLSALPVIMPACSPNDAVLPERWLVPGRVTGSFMTRMMVELFEADAQALGGKLDWLAGLSDAEMLQEKTDALVLGYEKYSMEAVKPLWEEVLRQ